MKACVRKSSINWAISWKSPTTEVSYETSRSGVRASLTPACCHQMKRQGLVYVGHVLRESAGKIRLASQHIQGNSPVQGDTGVCNGEVR